MPPRPRPSFALEQTHWPTGALVIALDEAGRGPLSGCCMAGAACLLPSADPQAWDWVRDSKTLSETVIRDRAALVRSGAMAAHGLWAWGLGAASPREIDRLNIRRATALAMARAARRVVRLARRAGSPFAADAPVILLVDGTPMPDLPYPQQAFPKLDGTSISCGLASIMAKDARDRIMHRLAARYAPDFACWASDVGYPSPAHRAALAAHGPIPGVHRYSYAPVRAAAEAQVAAGRGRGR